MAITEFTINHHTCKWRGCCSKLLQRLSWLSCGMSISHVINEEMAVKCPFATLKRMRHLWWWSRMLAIKGSVTVAIKRSRFRDLWLLFSCFLYSWGAKLDTWSFLVVTTPRSDVNSTFLHWEERQSKWPVYSRKAVRVRGCWWMPLGSLQALFSVLPTVILSTP